MPCRSFYFQTAIAIGFQLPETLQFITGGHLTDVFLDLCCVILDRGSDGYQPPTSHFPLCAQSQDAEIGVKLSLHCEELSCLDISSIYLLLWPGYCASGVSVDWQGICVDGLAFVLLIQLTLQDLPYSL